MTPVERALGKSRLRRALFVYEMNRSKKNVRQATLDRLEAELVAAAERFVAMSTGHPS